MITFIDAWESKWTEAVTAWFMIGVLSYIFLEQLRKVAIKIGIAAI
jgi:hypothetical protein